MARFLFVVPPLVGHINPAVGLGAELTSRGHEVAWAGHGSLVRALVGSSATVFHCDAVEVERPPELKGPAALQFLWEQVLIPLADAMAGGVRSALESFEPDVVVADQQAIAGGLIADQLGLTWVTSATTSAELTDPLASMPKVAAWLDGLLGELRGRIAGGVGTADPRFSPHGVLAFTTSELVGSVDLADRLVWFVGPSIGARPASSDFPWEWFEDGTPTVLVSLGTANHDAGRAIPSYCGRGAGRVGREGPRDRGGSGGRARC
ncbi:hypothetical protein EV643_109235 [Kribbella sp. VKM Ac-2527]|uniref:MGT family glycosyltransferase n=1 Tax=Kribbella caucasensis TaxID=2512215 RepID=A0A4R6KF17_9ACTN|nr:hypothetical protein [Kribbella sp. VKM Ac-2527]TDO47338.1 hypothetical protein EV643_109235 [Kribbella sp. VKM Ac-2527]